MTTSSVFTSCAIPASWPLNLGISTMLLLWTGRRERGGGGEMEGMKEGGGEKDEQTAGGCLNASSQIESL